MQPRHESPFVLEIVEEDFLSKVLHASLPSWGCNRDIRQAQQRMVSVDKVDCAIDAMRTITAQIKAFALEDACITHELAEVAGCALVWYRFESRAVSRESQLRTLREYVRRRTSRWRRVMLPVDMSSVFAAYHLIVHDGAEFEEMLPTLKAKRSV